MLSQSVRRSRVEDRARRRLGMEPIVLDDELLARITRMGGDARVSSLLDRSTPDHRRPSARVLDEQEYEEIAARLRCSESVIRQRVSRGLATLRRIYEKRRGRMSEFPALHESLVRAARAAAAAACRAAVPAFAVGVAWWRWSLPGPRAGPRARGAAAAGSRSSRPSGSSGARSDRPTCCRPPGARVEIDRARTRLLGQGGPTRFYAAPSTIRRVPSLCLAAVRRQGRGGGGLRAGVGGRRRRHAAS